MKLLIDDKYNIGVYQIRNLENDNIYIGGTKCSFYKRFYNHRLHMKENNHNCKKLNSAVMEYGIDAFVFELIEVCNKDVVLEREQFFIDLLNPIYNGNRNVTGKGRKASDEVRADISKRMIGNKRSFGVKKTEADRLGISLRNKERFKQKGYWEKVFAESRYKPVSCSTDDNSIVLSFGSIKEAYQTLGIDQSTIFDNIKGVTKYSKFTYKNNKIKVKWKRDK